MSTIEVYVNGNVYYELEQDNWTEIKAYFDDSIPFTVPAGEDYEELLKTLVLASAKERIQKLLPNLVLEDSRFTAELSVHKF